MITQVINDKGEIFDVLPPTVLYIDMGADHPYQFPIDTLHRHNLRPYKIDGELVDKPKMKYVGVVEPHEGVGSGYNAGTIWVETKDGNFQREGALPNTWGGVKVERETFLRFVKKGYLAPMYPAEGMEQAWLDKIKKCNP